MATPARQYRGGEPGDADKDRRDQPVRVRVGPRVGKAQYDAVKGLVVQVEWFADRPDELSAPVDRGGVRQQREPKSYRDREGQRADRRGLYSPREQQVRNQDQRRELDPRRLPDSYALALHAVGQRDIAHHHSQQHEVDLPEEQRPRTRVEPEAHSGPRTASPP